MNNIAIIPARSGSKGLKDKNIKMLNGKPLLSYTIEAAVKSGQFEEVMVSTDSEEYAKIAKKYGASVPFLRSLVLSTDAASSWDVVEEVLEAYKSNGREFDTVCLLQPTSPLRDSNDIINAYARYEEKDAIAIVSVCEMEHSPQWSNTLNEEQELNGFIKRNNAIQRQAIEKYYRLNGAIYIVKTEEFCKDRFIYREGCYAYIMEQTKSVDIDTELDFKIAEVYMK